MMSKHDAGAIAQLASIRLSEKEQAFMAQELEAVVNWINRLFEVDVGDVTLHVATTSMPEREDIVTEKSHRDEILANAPGVVDQWFAVPKMIKQ